MRDGTILLGERQNTGFEDGKYHFPAGHLEDGETVVEAIIREMREELGIEINPRDLCLALVMHHKDLGDARVGLFFATQTWRGTIINNEPNKCRQLQWFRPDQLPPNLVPYARAAIDAYAQGQVFAIYGF